MIEAKNLKKVYSPKKGASVKALDDVSLKLPDKGMVFILGKSGSGKSTLLNVLGGLDSVDSGEILIKGTTFKDFGQKHYDSYRNTYVGFIFQEYNILEEFTIGANIALAIELQGRRATDEEVSNILKEVDLDGFGQRKPNELSGGQKQRVAIARALVKNPEIIMADEPTGALDSKTGKQIFDTLKNLSKEKLVVIVSHDRDFAEQYADRIIELADGKIISDVELSAEGRTIAESTDESGLDFDGDKITIKSGYTITEDDRIAINSYISALRNDATISIGMGKKKISSAAFVPTDESKIEIKKDSSFKLIKSKLSLRNAFKLGANGLKFKKFRLVLTILLSFIAFTLFGVADTIGSYDNVSTAVKSLRDSNIDYASFNKAVKYKYSSGDDDDFYWNKYDIMMNDADIARIKEKTGIDLVGVYRFGNYWGNNMSFSSNIPEGNSFSEDGKDYSRIYSSNFTGFAEMTQEDLDKYGYEWMGNSRFPNRSDEIAISSFVYNYFTKVGYTYYDEVEGERKTIEVNSPDDLIGKTLTVTSVEKTLKIVGIYNTKFDETRYSALAESQNQQGGAFSDTLIDFALSAELDSVKSYSLNLVAVVNKGFIAANSKANDSVLTSLEASNSSVQLKKSLGMYTNQYGYEDEKTAFWTSISKMAQFSAINSSGIVFFDQTKTTLGENEFIVSLPALKGIISNASDVYLYNTPILAGTFEETYSNLYTAENNGKYNLDNIVSSYKTIALAKYAYENQDVAKQFILEYHQNSGWIDEDWLNGLSLYGMINEYASCKLQNPLSAEDKALCASYLSGLAQRYDFTAKVLDSTLMDSIPDNYNGTIVFARDYAYNLWDIVSLRYANANFQTALERYFIGSDESKQQFLDAMDYYNGTGTYDPETNYNWYIEDKNSYNSTLNDITNQYYYYCTSQYNSNNKDANLYATLQNLYIEDLIKLLNTLDITEGLSFSANANSQNVVKIDGTASIVGIAMLEGEEDEYFIIVPNEIFAKIMEDQGSYSFVVGPMPTDDASLKKAIELSYDESGDVKYELSNSVTFELFSIDGILSVLGKVFLFVGLGFALFAALMLSNFIATSISYKKQEIGILRAIGSRSSDVFKIFFSESFIIAMINFILAIIGTVVTCVVVNSIFREDIGLQITFLNFGIRQVALLLLVSLAIAVIATFLPVRKTAAKKPIEAIRKR